MDMHESLSGNIVFEWWCPKCGAYHYQQYCPKDESESTESININADSTLKIEICPCCGQLRNKYDYYLYYLPPKTTG